MLTFAIAAVVFLVVVGAMAIGVIFSNREIKGSCGGLAGMRTENGESFCEVCGAPSVDACKLEDGERRAG